MDNVSFIGNYVNITIIAFGFPKCFAQIRNCTLERKVSCSYYSDKNRLKRLKEKNIWKSFSDLRKVKDISQSVCVFSVLPNSTNIL